MTCRMSFVFAYSVVPFQWRRVWIFIWFRRGLQSFMAKRLRWRSYVHRIFWSCPELVYK